jgi:hypothetical protein
MRMAWSARILTVFCVPYSEFSENSSETHYPNMYVAIQVGCFDIVLCLGLMYHISKHVELMEKISEVNDDVPLINITLAQ